MIRLDTSEPITPVAPTGTKAIVLMRLQRGEELESIGAIHSCGTTRLAKYIHLLRCEGHAIRTEFRKSHNGKTFAVYSMETVSAQRLQLAIDDMSEAYHPLMF